MRRSRLGVGHSVRKVRCGRRLIGCAFMTVNDLRVWPFAAILLPLLGHALRSVADKHLTPSALHRTDGSTRYAIISSSELPTTLSDLKCAVQSDSWPYLKSRALRFVLIAVSRFGPNG